MTPGSRAPKRLPLASLLLRSVKWPHGPSYHPSPDRPKHTRRYASTSEDSPIRCLPYVLRYWAENVLKL